MRESRRGDRLLAGMGRGEDEDENDIGGSAAEAGLLLRIRR